MEGYNSKQKLYITIAIIVFIVINLIAVVIALPALNKGSVKGIYTNSLYESVLVSGNLDKEVTIPSDKEFNTSSDSLYLKNLNYRLLSLPQSRLSIDGSNLILNTGVYYIESLSSLTVKAFRDIVINPESKVIFDAEEGNTYILHGSVDVNGKQFYAGTVFNVNADVLNGNVLNKDQLLATNKVKELNALLAKKSLFVAELNFLAIPNLEIKDNLLEIESEFSFYNIEGKVDGTSNVLVNSELAKVYTDGNFEKEVQLQPGLNTFDVTVVDEVANTKTITLKINYIN